MTGTRNGGPKRSVQLQAFHVSGFRSLVDAGMSLEPDVTVLVGRNDVGKTSFLDALHLYGQFGKNGFRPTPGSIEAYAEAEGTAFTARWIDKETGEEFEHTIRYSPEAPEERLAWGDTECIWAARTRALRYNGRDVNARGIRRFSSLGSVSESDWQTETELPDEIARGLGTAGAFETPIAYLFEPETIAWGAPLDMDTAGRDGFGIATLLQDVINRRDESLEILEDALRSLFPYFRRVTVVEERWEATKKVVAEYGDAVSAWPRGLPGHEQRVERFVQGESERNLRFEIACPEGSQLFPDCRWVPAHAVSSGILLALAHFTLCMATDKGALLEVEEPENGLNPTLTLDMIKAFMGMVRDRGLQLVMTTHNEFWLDYVETRSIRVFTRDVGGIHIHADPENFQKIRDDGLYLSEVVGLGGPEQLLFPRGGQQ